MYDYLQHRIDQTKKFISEHETLVACMATAVITRKITHKAVMKAVLEETTDLSFKWGQDFGFIELQRDALLDFVNEKGMGSEVLMFIEANKK